MSRYRRNAIYFFGKKIAFPAFSLLFLILDRVIKFQFEDFSTGPLLLSLALAASVGLIPWLPKSMTTLAIVLICALHTLPPVESRGGIVTLLSVLVLVELYSRGQWIRGLACQVLFISIYYVGFVYLDSSSAETVLLTGLLESAVSLAVGSAIFLLNEKVKQEEREKEKSVEKVRLDLAFALHDSVATELTKALLALRQTIESGVGGRAEYELHFVERHLQSGLEKVRGITSTMSDLVDNEAVSLEELLRAEKASLERSHRVFRLNGVIPPDLHQRLGDLKYHLVISFVREALMNCLKYAPRNSQVDCEIFAGKTHIEVLVLSDLADQTRAVESTATSSHLGIDGLQHRASALGASVEAGALEGRWVISLAVPLIADHEIFSVGEHND